MWMFISPENLLIQTVNLILVSLASEKKSNRGGNPKTLLVTLDDRWLAGNQSASNRSH